MTLTMSRVGDAFGDAHRHLDPGGRGLEDGVPAAKAGGTKIREVLAPVSLTAWATVFERRDGLHLLAALAPSGPPATTLVRAGRRPGIDRAFLSTIACHPTRVSLFARTLI